MKVKLKNNVRLRKDQGFGGIVYVPQRDDFFAVDSNVFDCINLLTNDFADFDLSLEETYLSLAKLGICEFEKQNITEIPYSGPSFLGSFPEIPTVQKPLVVNCFSTSFCPLNCIYCYANDLMMQYRNTQNSINTIQGQYDIDNIITTASMIPAIVAVITGGDPLFNPGRTIKLIEGLSSHKSLVLDTSGFGFIDELIPTLTKYNVHVRVSLDSLGKDNDLWRITNPKYENISDLKSPCKNAIRTINKCLQHNLNVSVQTVVHSKNDSYGQLLDLRDGLIALGVRHWILHLAVRGGLAREIEMASEKKARGGIMPKESIRNDLWKIIESTINNNKNIDIRCTDNDSTPNSVLLINSEGDLFTEGLACKGKVKIYDVKKHQPDQFRAMWSFIDWSGHTRRYLNWNKWSFGNRDLKTICYSIPKPISQFEIAKRSGLVSKEKKFKVLNYKVLVSVLISENFCLRKKVLQVDEYFDTKKGNLESFNYILRIRREKNLLNQEECKEVSIIGPSFFSDSGDYTQFEISIPVLDRNDLDKKIKLMSLENVFIFEKKRTSYAKESSSLEISLDEIPEIGFFIELSGNSNEIDKLVMKLKNSLGNSESRNYKDIFIEYQKMKGIENYKTQGPFFKNETQMELIDLNKKNHT